MAAPSAPGSATPIQPSALPDLAIDASGLGKIYRSKGGRQVEALAGIDLQVPRDTTKFLQTAQQMADFLQEVNPRAEIYYTATWSRADEIYPDDGAWHGTAIDVMARDVRRAYDTARSREPAIKSINPVGDSSW